MTVGSCNGITIEWMVSEHFSNAPKVLRKEQENTNKQTKICFTVPFSFNSHGLVLQPTTKQNMCSITDEIEKKMRVRKVQKYRKLKIVRLSCRYFQVK